MTRPLFMGDFVRLSAINPEKDAELMAAWTRDSLLMRLVDAEPVRELSTGKIKEQLAHEVNSKDGFFFAIYTLTDSRLIGKIGLESVQWVHRSAYVMIEIGESDLWGKGLGTDAMHELLRFAFLELNLHRITLTVFEYNQRAIRSYQKIGFVEEGRSARV